MRISFDGRSPRIAPTAFIAAGTIIIGDVEISSQASIWFNTVLRGDMNSIRVGSRSVILDECVIHVEAPTPVAPEGFATTIGEDVFVGQGSMIHGCTIRDRAFVGAGAIVMNGCVIESGAMLAAGAMLVPNRTIAAGELWEGRPARHAGKVSPAEAEANKAMFREHLALSVRYRRCDHAGH